MALQRARYIASSAGVHVEPDDLIQVDTEFPCRPPATHASSSAHDGEFPAVSERD